MKNLIPILLFVLGVTPSLARDLVADPPGRTALPGGIHAQASDGPILLTTPSGVREVKSLRPGVQQEWPALAGDAGRAVLVWMEGDAAASAVVAAEVVDGEVGSAVQVSATMARASRFPAVTMADDGTVWIAWVDGAMESDDILVARGVDGSFSTPQRVSARDDSEDLVPQVALDGSGTPMVIWAGLDGEDDEIMFSRLQDEGWTPEARLNPDKPIPRYHPLDGGRRIGEASRGVERVRRYQLSGSIRGLERKGMVRTAPALRRNRGGHPATGRDPSRWSGGVVESVSGASRFPSAGPRPSPTTPARAA